MAIGERREPLGGIEEARVGDHICWAYPPGFPFLDAAARYIGAGLSRGERIACLMPDDRLDQVRSHLARLVPELESAAERGAAVFGSTQAAYFPDGRFDPDARLDAYAEMVEATLADGYSALRVFADATEVLNDPRAAQAWPAYELRADLLATRLPFLAVCAYDVDRCEPDALETLRAVHGSAIGTWEQGRPSFTLHASRDGALVLGGEIDLATSGTVGALARAAAPDVMTPVIDLTDLRFIDVSGMRAVVDSLRSLGAQHQRIEIRGAGPAFRRVWDLLGCERYVGVELELV